MIVDGHVYRCEDGGSTGIEGGIEEEEDEMVEVGRLEAHHSAWETLRFAGSGSVHSGPNSWRKEGEVYTAFSLHEASET